jgi:hypothetical protein
MKDHFQSEAAILGRVAKIPQKEPMGKTTPPEKATKLTE